MAVMKHTGDRRAFLAAGMGTIVAVGVAPAAFATTIAPAANRAAWDAALADWRKAHKNLYDWRGPEDVPSSICDAETATWRRMLDTPAPDRAALKVKLDQLLKVEECVDCTNAWDADEVRQTMADVARLLSDA